MSVGQPHWYQGTKRRPFISVYPDNRMLGEYVCAYNPEQREWRERKIERGVGARPAYRINIRFHNPENRGRRSAEKQMRLYDATLALAREEGRID